LMHSVTLGVSSLVLTVSMFINLTTMMWFTYKNIKYLEAQLSDCRCITDFRNIWQGGVIGRHMRFNLVMMIITFPNAMYRRGDITKDAHHRIPLRLKRWIWGIYIFLYINGFCLALLGYLIKVSRESAT
jgi:hypothetical protein